MKGRKKQFPPGTFIPTPARVVAILQLCLAFTVIFWSCGYPFMGELFELKSEMLVYRNVMGNMGSSASVLQEVDSEQRIFLKRNAERFQQLPEWQKESIALSYQKLQKAADAPFLTKFWKGISSIFLEMQRFEQAWILFSLIIPIMILIRIEGAVVAAWILPLLVFFYAIANQIEGQTAYNQKGEALFPSEQEIVKNYLKKPLSLQIMQQRQELLQGWQLYLIREWAKAIPSEDPALFNLQVEQGEFAFNLARIEAFSKEPHLSPFQKKEPWPLLLLYLAWNLFFAAAAGVWRDNLDNPASVALA